MAKITISPEADQDTADIVALLTKEAGVAPYVAVYELDEDHVIVLRVLDGRRNITRRLIRQ